MIPLSAFPNFGLLLSKLGHSRDSDQIRCLHRQAAVPRVSSGWLYDHCAFIGYHERFSIKLHDVQTCIYIYIYIYSLSAYLALPVVRPFSVGFTFACSDSFFWLRIRKRIPRRVQLHSCSCFHPPDETKTGFILRTRCA